MAMRVRFSSVLDVEPRMVRTGDSECVGLISGLHEQFRCVVDVISVLEM